MKRLLFCISMAVIILGGLSSCSTWEQFVFEDDQWEIENQFRSQKWNYGNKNGLKPGDSDKKAGSPKVIVRDVPEVRYFIDHYTNGRKVFVSESLERGSQYLPMIHTVFRNYGLPVELNNIAVVESGFDQSARSNKGAVGVWQFIKSTARYYGLTVSLFRDERKDVYKSTIAAARFLRDLYDYYGDWYLVLAAYNGGMGRVNKAIDKAQSRDFFVISRKGFLPSETREYVPRVLAMMIIRNDLKRYGFGQI